MEVDQLIPASKKRLALAAYIDFLFFSALWALGSYLLLAGGGTPFWLKFAVFSVLEATLLLQFGSPGLYFLSIGRVRRSTMLPEVQGAIAVGTLVVDPAIYKQESWLPMLLGVACVLEGTKAMVRWTQWGMPLPVFGLSTDPITFAVISSVWGLALIYLGYVFFKLKKTAFGLGLGMASVALVSTAMSWNRWDAIAKDLVIRRRQYQGLAIREGEIEAMQALVPEAFIIVLLITMVAITLTRERLPYA